MTIKLISAVVGIVGAGALVGGDSKGITLGEDARRELGLEVGVVELRHVAESKDPVIAVPLAALLEETGTFVYLRKGETDSFVKQKVELGLRGEDYAELISGAFPGDGIVVKNVGRVREATEKAPEVASQNAKENAPEVVASKGGEKPAKRRGGFVDRDEEVTPAVEEKASENEVEKVAKTEGSEKSSRVCPDCGKESVARGICRNGYCDVPRGAPPVRFFQNYGPSGYCPPSFGHGAGGCNFGGYSNCPPPSCPW